jgi:inorganic pyrophosphatase
MLNNDEIIVVTTGQAWADIDAFACVVAYTELLNLLGQRAVAVIPGPLNASVPESYRSLGTIETVAPESYGPVVIMDLSNPEYFASFAALDSVKEIFDHHSGFESFWNDRLGKQSHIEMIGAAATFIWEEIERAGMTEKISKNSARLLAAAIASNTLNFQIAITCDRDHIAFAAASRFGAFDQTALSDYFAACESTMVQGLPETLLNDTKRESTPQFPTPITIGQMELWHSESVVRAHTEAIASALSKESDLWLLDAPSIGDRYTVLYCRNAALRDSLSGAIAIEWNGDIGKTDHLMLRKEILKALRA